MRRRATLNLVLLAVALSLAAVAWQVSDDSGPSALTSLDPGEVRELQVRYPDANERPEFRLQRRNDGWHVVEPIERPARDGRLVTVLAILAETAESCYPVDEHDPADFGLDPPSVVLATGHIELAFGARAADGRRYVRAGGRLCLVPDRARPLLANGLDGLARLVLLPAGTTLTRIETPTAMAERATPASDWSLRRGSGDAQRWPHHWQGARARSVILQPPAANLGSLHVVTAGGEMYRWRIAQREDELLLVPEGTTYGLAVEPSIAATLLRPPAPEAGNDP